METAPASGSAAGLVCFLRRGTVERTHALWLSALNPATGSPVWERPIRSPEDSLALFPPQFATGAIIAVAVTDDEIQAWVPRLDGSPPPPPCLVDASRIDARMWGPIESDTRLAVQGDLIHVLRTSHDGRASVGTVELDRRVLEGEIRGDAAVWHPPAKAMFTGPSLSGAGDPQRAVWPLFVAWRATQEGVWADATLYDPGGGPASSRIAWFEPGARADRWVVFSTTSTVIHAQPPVRVGRRMLLATDEGFLVVPLVEAERAISR